MPTYYCSARIQDRTLEEARNCSSLRKGGFCTDTLTEDGLCTVLKQFTETQPPSQDAGGLPYFAQSSPKRTDPQHIIDEARAGVLGIDANGDIKIE